MMPCLCCSLRLRPRLYAIMLAMVAAWLCLAMPLHGQEAFRSSFDNMRLVDVTRDLGAHFGVPVVALPEVAGRFVRRVETGNLASALGLLAQQINGDWWHENGIYFIGHRAPSALRVLRLRGLPHTIENILGHPTQRLGDSLLYRADDNDARQLEDAYRQMAQRPVLPVRLVVLSTDDNENFRAGFDPALGLAMRYVADWDSVVNEANDFLAVGLNINTALDLSLLLAVVEVEVDTHALLLSGETFEIEVSDVFQREVSERTGDTNSPVFRTGFIETKVGLRIQLEASFISETDGWQIRYFVSDADGNQDQENRVQSRGVTILPPQATMRSIVTLKRTRLQEQEKSIPFLRRVPVAGYLFRRNVLNRRTRNLAVLIASSGTMPLTMSGRTLDPQMLPHRRLPMVDNAMGDTENSRRPDDLPPWATRGRSDRTFLEALEQSGPSSTMPVR